MDAGLEAIQLITSIDWKRTDDDPTVWTGWKDGLFHMLISHREGGRAMLDVTVFHPKGGLLREWRWTLGSTFDALPNLPVEGRA